MLYKEYHTLPSGQEIKFSISFNRSSTNWTTYQPKKIGYEVHALPVERSSGAGFSIEESGCFTGFCDNLIEVERQSAKRLQAAISELGLRREKYLNYFINKELVGSINDIS